MSNWKAGDWVVFGLNVGQIKEIRNVDIGEFSTGFTVTSGRILERCRPLTLRNKRIVETFDHIYDSLRNIAGEAGFNYPDISLYFANLALMAIDSEENESDCYTKATAFIAEAKNYKPKIQGVELFRPKLP